jgi:hypothetical protein
MLINGCVFFICTEADTGEGSGKTVIRAVSFFGPGEEGAMGRGAAVADGFEAPEMGGATKRGG